MFVSFPMTTSCCIRPRNMEQHTSYSALMSGDCALCSFGLQQLEPSTLSCAPILLAHRPVAQRPSCLANPSNVAEFTCMRRRVQPSGFAGLPTPTEMHFPRPVLHISIR